MIVFNGIDDIMGIVKENEDEEGEVNLVSGKSLNTLFCEFKRAKYEPKIIMGAGGNVASLKVKFNKIDFEHQKSNIDRLRRGYLYPIATEC